MNINSLIGTALAPLALPVYANFYEGTADEYIVFNYADERPALRADDNDELDETVIQVHYFTKTNPQSHKRNIRKYMRAAGFTIMSTSEFYESDMKYFHVIIEAWIEGSNDDGTVPSPAWSGLQKTWEQL